MIRQHTSPAVVLYAIPATAPLCAADWSNYRGFQLGENLATAAKQVRQMITRDPRYQAIKANGRARRR